MATLTAKLTLSSTTATSDSLNLSVSDVLTFSNDVILIPKLHIPECNIQKYSIS